MIFFDKKKYIMNYLTGEELTFFFNI